MKDSPILAGIRSGHLLNTGVELYRYSGMLCECRRKKVKEFSEILS
jgi:hypothetical protein